MIRFIGAGPGAPDLLTLRGAKLLAAADIVIYAGSLVNPALLECAQPGCERYDSANMTLEEVIDVMEAGERAGKSVVRLHSGDPSLYGAVREQTDALDRRGIAWDITPGVSSFCGAAASLGVGYTVPGVVQSVILTRAPGRTPVPEDLRELAAHGVSMALFLSGGELETVQRELLSSGGYASDAPAAIVYKATWPDEIALRCTLGTLAEAGRRAGIRKTALVLVGDFLNASGERSKLYDPAFSTEYRKAQAREGKSVTQAREGESMAREGIAYLSFTERGKELAERLRGALGGDVACTRNAPGASGTHNVPGLSLSRWTAENFPVRRALVYVGAVGIAVRAIAPHLRGKAVDPAVVAVDERGLYAAPLASGHLGGANDLARRIAALTGGTAVVTTATDIRGAFAVDEWARRQDCAVIHPEAIKNVSAKVLAGETLRVFSAFAIAGEPPEGVELWETAPDVAELSEAAPDGAESPDVWLDTRRHPALSLAPRVLVLGVGCRRGTTAETLERRFLSLCATFELWPEAFAAAATIDLKADEPGLLAFCASRGWALRTFRADELRQVPGTFSASAFVEARTGVENVCERAAVLLSGGEALIKKQAGEGVTLAVARRPVRLDWSWETWGSCT